MILLNKKVNFVRFIIILITEFFFNITIICFYFIFLFITLIKMVQLRW